MTNATAPENAGPVDASVAESEDGAKSSRGRARAFTWRRAVAYSFAAATLALASPAEGRFFPYGFYAGAAVALIGEALRVWGCGHLRKNKDVITSGPYAYVRNPLYLGTLLIIVGFCVAAGNTIVMYGLLPVGLIGFFAYYTPKKERVESDRLRRRFGAQFDVYHAAVPGYLPRITRWKDASNLPWSAPLVVENTEIPTALLVAAGLTVLALRGFVS